MKAFVCVYRHIIPTDRNLRKTQERATSLSSPVPLLQAFVGCYRQTNCFFDWGDDPGFFAATKLLGNACQASWGVCRRDVRAQICPGDFVIWFCAHVDPSVPKAMTYYYIGCTTVAKVIDRAQLWNDVEFVTYRGFFNTLARPNDGELVQHEYLYEWHKDWEKRANAPYIIFDSDPAVSAVNLDNPALVATSVNGLTETWKSASDSRVSEIECAIFRTLGIARRLRTKNPYQPHRHIPLHKAPNVNVSNQEKMLSNLRSSALRLARDNG